MWRRLAVLSVALIISFGGWAGARSIAPAPESWSREEIETLRALTLSELAPLEPDPSNRYGDDSRAAALGERLFFDGRLSSSGAVSCASCHVPEKDFQDGTPLAHGVGTTTRRTMPIAGTAHGAWMFWDGRKDSQWSQALGPLESPVEHGGDRTQYVHLMAAAYRAEYEAIFGAIPDLAGLPARAGPVADSARHAAWRRMPAARQEDVSRVYANIGKAIAAYERRLEPAPGRFDRYVDALKRGRRPDAASALTPDETAGLRIFIGKGNCANCHNGPLLTDDHFHNTGVAAVASLPPDSGRAAGVRQVLADEFNCLGRFSDARPHECGELRFATTEGEELVRAYKTPSLRGVAARAPYMHAGQLATLDAVVDHYDRAPAAPAGHSELAPLHLTARERAQLVAFLRTLSAPVTVR